MPKITEIVQINEGFRRRKFVEVVEKYSVTFNGCPQSIIYHVDGNFYGYGQTVELEKNRYTYTASADNYMSMSGTFIVQNGDLAVAASLQALTTNVKFITSVLGAEIFIDGQSKGIIETSEKILTINAGNHTYLAIKTGIPSSSGVFDASPNTQSVVQLNFNQTSSRINITSSAANSAVSLDSVFLGNSPISIDKPAGSYSIRVQAEGFNDFLQNVNLSSGNNVEVRAQMTLKPVNGEIFVAANQSLSEVFVNNNGIGQVPIRKSYVAGDYQITVRKTGFSDFVQQVAVVNGEVSSVLALLNPIEFIPNGTLIREYCVGLDKYCEYHDGVGGKYSQLLESNSAFCNAVQTAIVNFQFNYTPSGEIPFCAGGIVFQGVTSPVEVDSLVLKDSSNNILVKPYNLSPGNYTGTIKKENFHDINFSFSIFNAQKGTIVTKIINTNSFERIRKCFDCFYIFKLDEPGFLQGKAAVLGSARWQINPSGISIFAQIGSQNVFGQVLTKGNLSLSNGQSFAILANGNVSATIPLPNDADPSRIYTGKPALATIIQQSGAEKTATYSAGTSSLSAQGGSITQRVDLNFWYLENKQTRSINL